MHFVQGKISSSFSIILNYASASFKFHFLSTPGSAKPSWRCYTFAVTPAREEPSTFRAVSWKIEVLSMIDLAYLSPRYRRSPTSICFPSVLAHSPCAPRRSPFAHRIAICPFLRSTRSNWSREKLGFISVSHTYTRFSLVSMQGVSAVRRERRRRERRDGRWGDVTHCSSSCHWGFGNTPVYASGIAPGNVSSNLFH